MGFSQHLERGLIECFVDGRGATFRPLPFRVGGSWFCPSSGLPISEAEPGLVMCSDCSLSPGEFIHELVELHPRRGE